MADPSVPLPEGWTPRTLVTLRRNLLAWFDEHRRELPWRASRDPYRIWVSEVMLQQTTVAAVIPYFERFLAAFPDVATLAAAEEQTVLRHWSGLGYYRRARHLHQSAKMLVEHHDGTLPDDPIVWAALPGVGRYILGAVLSQAFDRKLPIVEANSQRVLSRWFGSREDPRVGDGRKWVWLAAEAVLPTKRIGDFNQAMMELGSLVCTPTQPACGVCPVRSICVANREGLQSEIPPKPLAKTVIEVREIAVVIHDATGCVLVCQRPADAIRWANMWEVPHAETRNDETDEVAVVRITEELTGFTVSPGQELLTVRHGVTRSAITMHCLAATRTQGRFRPGHYTESRWLQPSETQALPMSSPQRKLFEELTRTGRQLRLC